MATTNLQADNAEKLANVISKFEIKDFKIDNVLNGFLFYICLEKLSYVSRNTVGKTNLAAPCVFTVFYLIFT